MLAISGLKDVLTCLHHDGDGFVTINSRNDQEEDGVATLIAAVGFELEHAVGATLYHARKLVTRYEAANGETAEELKALTDGVKPEWLENWYDGLTYCTWNGLGQNLNEQKMFDALESLKKNNINITSLIIDVC